MWGGRKKKVKIRINSLWIVYLINNNKFEGGFEVLDGMIKILDRVIENIFLGDDLRKSRRELEF